MCMGGSVMNAQLFDKLSKCSSVDMQLCRVTIYKYIPLVHLIIEALQKIPGIPDTCQMRKLPTVDRK